MRDIHRTKIKVSAHAMTMHDNDRRILATRRLPQPITVHVTRAITQGRRRAAHSATTRSNSRRQKPFQSYSSKLSMQHHKPSQKGAEHSVQNPGNHGEHQRPSERSKSKRRGTTSLSPADRAWGHSGDKLPHFAPPADRDYGHSRKLLCS